MTEEELLKQFHNVFEMRDCYEPICELRDCCECSIYKDAFEEYIQELGYKPSAED